MKRIIFVLKINDKKTNYPQKLLDSIKKYVDRKCAGAYVKKIELQMGYVDCDIITNKVTIRVDVNVDSTSNNEQI